MIHSLCIITASTSGHTDFVLDEVVKHLRTKCPLLVIKRKRAELATFDDFLESDALILGSGTWNTGGVEGQLNPFMHQLLLEKCKDIKLPSKPIAFVSLGDDRYYFTTRCTEHFLKFQRASEAVSLVSPLIIVNEPYDQTEKMLAWADKLVAVVRK